MSNRNRLKCIAQKLGLPSTTDDPQAPLDPWDAYKRVQAIWTPDDSERFKALMRVGIEPYAPRDREALHAFKTELHRRAGLPPPPPFDPEAARAEQRDEEERLAYFRLLSTETKMVILMRHEVTLPLDALRRRYPLPAAAG